MCYGLPRSHIRGDKASHHVDYYFYQIEFLERWSELLMGLRYLDMYCPSWV